MKYQIFDPLRFTCSCEAKVIASFIPYTIYPIYFNFLIVFYFLLPIHDIEVFKAKVLELFAIAFSSAVPSSNSQAETQVLWPHYEKGKQSGEEPHASQL